MNPITRVGVVHGSEIPVAEYPVLQLSSLFEFDMELDTSFTHANQISAYDSEEGFSFDFIDKNTRGFVYALYPNVPWCVVTWLHRQHYNPAKTIDVGDPYFGSEPL